MNNYSKISYSLERAFASWVEMAPDLESAIISCQAGNWSKGPNVHIKHEINEGIYFVILVVILNVQFCNV